MQVVVAKAKGSIVLNRGVSRPLKCLRPEQASTWRPAVRAMLRTTQNIREHKDRTGFLAATVAAACAGVEDLDFHPHGTSSGLVDRMVRSKQMQEIAGTLALIEAAHTI